MQLNPGQLSLDLLEVPPRPEATVWKKLSKAERAAAVAELAGMILTAALEVAPDRPAPKGIERESADA